MTFDVGIFVLLLSSCLQSITVAVPVPVNHPTNIAGTTESRRNGSISYPLLTGPTFPNPYAESSIASSKNKPPTLTSKGLILEDSSVSLAMKPTPKKRDAEEEADSANGKSPIPLLFKKEFSLQNEIGMNSLLANENDYSGFPPYTGSSAAGGGGVRYQRQRRSFPSESFSHSRRPDELEVSLDNDRDREAFLRLMALLASRETNPLSNYNNLLNTVDDFPLVKSTEDEGNFQDDDEAPLDLGYYGQGPFIPTSSQYDVAASAYNNPSISLMSSGNAGDLTRMGVHLSETPGSHGLYISPQQQANALGGEWLDEAVPLQSHLKTRRSDNTLFRYNPAKSHFRRYLRAPQMDIYENGRSFYPAPGARNRGMLIRKRRNSVAPFKFM